MTWVVARPRLLGRVVAVIGGATLLALGFMFSVILLAVIVVGGLTLWGYFWWKTRALRKVMREPAPTGQVIDGEAIVVEDYKVSERHVLPDAPNKL